MKRLISLLLSVITILSCFALGSCTDSEPDLGPGTADTSSVVSVEDAPDVVIATGEDPVYSLIRYIDAGSDEVDLIIDFKNALNAKFNMTFPISADWTAPSLAPAPDAPEIIIGLTGRDATSQTLDSLKLGYGDYAVQVCENNKIVLVAPNYKDLPKCFDYFLSNLESVETEDKTVQIVYNGGNYVSRTGEAHLWDACGGLPEFKIVYGKDGSNKKYAESIASAIKKEYDIVFPVICETEPKSGYEIIVGAIEDTSRIDYNFKKITSLGYEIVVFDTTILLAASSAASFFFMPL